MTYADYRARTAEIANTLPVFWAFSDKQFEEALAERGIAVEDASDKLYRFSNVAGGFYLKSDADKVKAYYENMQKATDDLKNLMETEDGFAYDAFVYEMYNHEYPINWEGDYDVCAIFGDCEYADAKDWSDYLTEMGYSDKVKKEFAKASRYVRQNGEW